MFPSGWGWGWVLSVRKMDYLPVDRVPAGISLCTLYSDVARARADTHTPCAVAQHTFPTRLAVLTRVRVRTPLCSWKGFQQNLWADVDTKAGCMLDAGCVKPKIIDAYSNHRRMRQLGLDYRPSQNY